jgi:cell wall-associated NlpC family hydrolase
MRRPGYVGASGENKVARILRGHMRRQTEIDPDNLAHFVRLHFMWNPVEVVREYISWVNEAGLDPQSVLGITSDEDPAVNAAQTTMGFSLYFDRQLEVATIKDHPGVLVDLQAFDILAGDSVAAGTRTIGLGPSGDRTDAVADPGIAGVDLAAASRGGFNETGPGVGNRYISPAVMVSIVLSPTMAFDGILQSATVSFVKFSPRMVPTAMRLDFTLALYRVGSMTNQSLRDLVGATSVSGSGAQPYQPEKYDPSKGFAPAPGSEEGKAANLLGPPNAINWGLQYEGAPYHNYKKGQDRTAGPPCNNKTPIGFDCSSFVWRCYKAIGWAEIIFPGTNCGNMADSDTIYNAIKSNANNAWERRDLGPLRDTTTTAAHAFIKGLRPGDIFVRKDGDFGKDEGHVAMYAGFSSGDGPSVNDKNCMKLHSTPPMTLYEAVPGKHLILDFKWWGRPKPFN